MIRVRIHELPCDKVEETFIQPLVSYHVDMFSGPISKTTKSYFNNLLLLLRFGK